MVEKNPFLSDNYQDSTRSSKYWMLRDAGHFRGLSNLFPAANLGLITKIAVLASKRRLPAGSYRIPQEKGSKGGSKIASIAVRVLSEDFPEEDKSLKTWQNYLDLATDMRILKQMPQQYVVHSYGQPLVHMAGTSPDGLIGTDNWRAYFIDRLLYEDGIWLQAILSILLQREKVENSKRLGLRMHEMIIDNIQQMIMDKTTPRRIRVELEKIRNDIIIAHLKAQLSKQAASRIRCIPGFIETPFHFDINNDHIPRRTELEFVVRRDWLQELGLIKKDNNEFSLMKAGEQLSKAISNNIQLNMDFFTTGMARILALLISNSHWKQPDDVINILEKLFLQLTREPLRIIETFVLINTAFFTNIPTFYGERQDILNALRKAVKNKQTSLVIQSAQRSRDFYVKSRVNRL